MSSSFFCPTCGHDLTHVSNQRLKCYGCEKFFVDSFEKTLCRCRKPDAFKYSVEIIALNKGKCVCCGRKMKVAGNLEPLYIDRYRGDRSKGLGSWDGQVDSFQPSSRKFKTAKPAKQKAPEKTPEIEKPEVDYTSENQDHIVIRFPGHERMEKIRCEIVNGYLEVQSLLVDFFRKFSLPEDILSSSIQTNLKNAVLDIRFKKSGEGKKEALE